MSKIEFSIFVVGDSVDKAVGGGGSAVGLGHCTLRKVRLNSLLVHSCLLKKGIGSSCVMCKRCRNSVNQLLVGFNTVQVTNSISDHFVTQKFTFEDTADWSSAY